MRTHAEGEGLAVMAGRLRYDVLVVDGEHVRTPASQENVPTMWSPTSATLIYGERKAVLIDGLMTKAHAQKLIEWVSGFGRVLETVYITHGHGDHFFGLAPLIEQHPDVRVVALPSVIADMAEATLPVIYDGVWNPLHGDQVPDTFVTPEPLDRGYIELEGNLLFIHRAGHTDRSDTTFVHVPNLELVVAGDIVYNGVFPYTVDTDRASRDEWRRALDAIALCNPKHVVAGHKAPLAEDGPQHIAATRAFLDDFDHVLDSGVSVASMFATLVDRHPDRLNRGALWLGLNAEARRRSKKTA